MGTTSIYKVHYHFEKGGKKASQDFIDWVSAAANDNASIVAVLNNNSRGVSGDGKLVIDAVMAAPDGPNTVLT